MDEFIKRKDAISAICFGCNQEFSDEPCEPKECYIRQAISNTPAADVVPKSEVDRLETEIRLLTENSISAKYPCCVSCSKGLILTKSLEEYDKLLADIASEVAREIFEEIDSKKIFLKDCVGKIGIVVRFKDIAELKKKYTKEGE